MAENLATIREILEINPIENADFIEVAKVMGWEVVVKKGEFKPMDLCVFVEIDSLVPNKEWSKFLFTGSHEEDEYHRLRTVKLRKQISQGLVLNVKVLIPADCNEEGYFKVGDDVTEKLGIKKYEKSVSLRGSGYKARNFPHFIRKTNEVRIQSNLKLLEELKGKPFYITQKLDGTSATFYKFKDEFGVCSRNIEIIDPAKLKGFYQHWRLKIRQWLGLAKKEIPLKSIYWQVAKKYKINEWIPDGYAIQGEICGPGIQGNKLGIPEAELFIFNVWNISEQKYINPMTPVEWSSLSKFVPDVEVNLQEKFNYTMEELLEIANNQKYPNGSPAEGIVVRSLDQEISFKVVSNVFALKYGE